MEAMGLLIDYELCTGCQSCEVSCKEEHDYPVGKWGIRVFDDGPWEIEPGHYNWNKIPVPSDLCDLCIDRTSRGREPICVHHCLGQRDVLRASHRACAEDGRTATSGHFHAGLQTIRKAEGLGTRTECR